MKIASVTVEHYRAPISEPVRTSFGVMPHREMVVLRLGDGAGHFGLGEIWCNFPTVTARYRAELAAHLLAGVLPGAEIGDIAGHHRDLSRRFAILALQSDEGGPIDAVLAGVDQALWDLAARRAGKPLRALLHPGAGDEIPAYASGINPGGAPDTVARAREAGHRAFKLKVGFDMATDRHNVETVAAALQEGERLFTDANQGWDPERALAAAAWLAPAGVGWLEEPLPVNAPAEAWRRLGQRCGLPLAGGENLRSHDGFATAGEWLGFLQPDVGKWGGVSDCLAVGRAALAAGRTYCPHWLGGGIGLAHSAELLAAVGGAGLLEMDINENPLRDAALAGHLGVAEGRVRLSPGPGIGLAPDLAALRAWRIGCVAL